MFESIMINLSILLALFGLALCITEAIGRVYRLFIWNGGLILCIAVYVLFDLVALIYHLNPAAVYRLVCIKKISACIMVALYCRSALNLSKQRTNLTAYLILGASGVLSLGFASDAVFGWGLVLALVDAMVVPTWWYRLAFAPFIGVSAWWVGKTIWHGYRTEQSPTTRLILFFFCAYCGFVLIGAIDLTLMLWQGWETHQAWQSALYLFWTFLLSCGTAFLYGRLIYEKLHKATEEKAETATKYQNSTLDSEKIEAYILKLDDAMTRDKLFRDPELTLGDVAQKLDLSRPQVSELINCYANTSFYDYVNKYRAEEFRSYLDDPKKMRLKITALAEEAGFKSKSTFYKAFKKHYGMTPTQFVKTVKQEKSA